MAVLLVLENVEESHHRGTLENSLAGVGVGAETVRETLLETRQRLHEAVAEIGALLAQVVAEEPGPGPDVDDLTAALRQLRDDQAPAQPVPEELARILHLAGQMGLEDRRRKARSSSARHPKGGFRDFTAQRRRKSGGAQNKLQWLH